MPFGLQFLNDGRELAGVCIGTGLQRLHGGFGPLASPLDCCGAIGVPQLAILLARTSTRRELQVYLLCSAVVLVMLVGISRVYLGVHWPSDVLFGWAVGAAWAALSSLATKRLQARRQIESSSNSYGS